MDKCPKCNSSWLGGSITEMFIKHRNERNSMWKGKTDEEIEQYVKEHYSPPYLWKREIGIEIQGEYDGISYYQCPDCETYFDRWTGEEVKNIPDEK